MPAHPGQGIRRNDYPVHRNSRPLSVFTVTGARPGPVLTAIGGVHGDEMEGPLTLSALLRDLDPAKLAGTVIICPVANGEAIAAYTRCSPADGKNLARCFPGDLRGSYTEALAALIAEHVIIPADYLVDLHSGGVALDSVTFAGYGDAPDGVGSKARAMAEAFGAPVVWRHEPPMAPGRTLSVADAHGIPAIYVEAGGGPSPPADVLQIYGAGMFGVLRCLGMYADENGRPPLPALHVVGAGDLDVAGPSPATGICTCHVNLLDRLAPDTVCFTIADLDGSPRATVRAGTHGYAMFLRRNRWVEAGELLMAVAVDDPA
ncbi:MAG: succinylglutamate desuccinylase/aspartoacylase family protein [Devosia sp.]|nr:succinylglutamate desuccinylase/aspartoacylase family protein [Devosia sp.]